MGKSVQLGLAVAATIGFAVLSTSADAGHGNAVGAGLLGFGVGAIVGSTLAPREVYVVPGPPPPPYYGPAAYGPSPWSPGWFNYCRTMYGPSFNRNTGYFRAGDGGWALLPVVR